MSIVMGYMYMYNRVAHDTPEGVGDSIEPCLLDIMRD
jgi:hypothetical protein